MIITLHTMPTLRSKATLELGECVTKTQDACGRKSVIHLNAPTCTLIYLSEQTQSVCRELCQHKRKIHLLDLHNNGGTLLPH